MRVNAQAALLASIGGVLLLIVGWTGVTGVDHFFALLESWFGTNVFLFVLSRIFGGIAALGGAAVIIGAYFLFTNRVWTGRILILVGSGAGFVTLVLFLARNLVREEFSYLLAVLPAIVGIALGITAQWRAKATPILP